MQWRRNLVLVEREWQEKVFTILILGICHRIFCNTLLRTAASIPIIPVPLPMVKCMYIVKQIQ